VFVPRIPKRFSAVLAHAVAGVLALGIPIGAAVPGAALAAEDDAGAPYWVSLRTQPANLRVGPGREYRISWVYVREGVPLKVLRMIGGWRLVEDIDGARGWMLAQFLTRTRTAAVKGGVAEIREKADGTGRLLWRAEPGVTGKLGDCGSVWCQIDIAGRQGYVAKAAVWGAD
jgi:SH3-like domain-containing protein